MQVIDNDARRRLTRTVAGYAVDATSCVFIFAPWAFIIESSTTREALFPQEVSYGPSYPHCTFTSDDDIEGAYLTPYVMETKSKLNRREDCRHRIKVPIVALNFFGSDGTDLP
jgi:hypothetical protein